MHYLEWGARTSGPVLQYSPTNKHWQVKAADTQILASSKDGEGTHCPESASWAQPGSLGGSALTYMTSSGLKDFVSPFLVSCKEPTTRLSALTHRSLRAAVALWLDPLTNALALDTYGHIANWNTEEITDMSFLFKDANSFTSDISNWKVDNVTTMESMFEGARMFNRDLSGWQARNTRNFVRIFSNSGIAKKDRKAFAPKWYVHTTTCMQTHDQDAAGVSHPTHWAYCDVNGAWKPGQMRAAGTGSEHFCVDEAGTEVPGSAVAAVVGTPPPTCQTQCQLARKDAKIGSASMDSYIPVCSKDPAMLGAFQPTQCRIVDAGTGLGPDRFVSKCFCVDAYGQEYDNGRNWPVDQASKWDREYFPADLDISDMCRRQTPCWKQVQKERLDPSFTGTLTTCTRYGDFHKDQCGTVSASTNQCWCVDRNGHELTGTRTGFTSIGVTAKCIYASKECCSRVYVTDSDGNTKVRHRWWASPRHFFPQLVLMK